MTNEAPFDPTTNERTATRGRVVIVTGASGGIGAGVVALFRDRGDVVVAADLDTGLDVTQTESCDRIVADTLVTHGRLDVLCNVAGVGAVGDVVTATDADWQRVFEVNVFGIARMCRSALPAMRARRFGRIVNVCSIAGSIGLPERAVYSASKGAAAALTRAIAADEARSGVLVNAVSPTTVEGPWIERLIADAPDPVAYRSALEARQPMGRLATAADVAEAIWYLASDALAVSGIDLTVDCGVTTMLNLPRSTDSGSPRPAGN